MVDRSDLTGMTLELDHKYRVGNIVHRGAMVTTYAGVWELFDLPIHVRSYESLIKLRLRHRDTTRIRWAIESEAGKVRGPNLPDTIDAGIEDPTKPFLVFRLPEGDLLLNRLRVEGRFDADRVVPVITGVARALGVCREVGMIHRGPTADRVWVGDDGEIVLLGVGEVLYRDDTISMSGAPSTELLWHIPPESFTVSQRRTDDDEDGDRATTLRLRTRPAGTLQGRVLEDDPRAEVYALGCLAYHALNAHHPFFTSMDDPTEGIHATIRDRPLEPRGWSSSRRSRATRRTDSRRLRSSPRRSPRRYTEPRRPRSSPPSPTGSTSTRSPRRSTRSAHWRSSAPSATRTRSGRGG